MLIAQEVLLIYRLKIYRILYFATFPSNLYGVLDTFLLRIRMFAAISYLDMIVVFGYK